MWSESFRLLLLNIIEHHDHFPGEIVMAEHASFGIASRSTGVDQTAAFSRFLLVHLHIDNVILDRLADLEEVSPEVEAGSRDALGQGSLTPDDESLDAIVLVEIDGESLEMLSSLNNDDFSFTMLSLVEAGVGLVSNVDSSVHVVVHHTTNEGNGPLR